MMFSPLQTITGIRAKVRWSYISFLSCLSCYLNILKTVMNYACK